jgi:energy-coupling factor transport system permease protein
MRGTKTERHGERLLDPRCRLVAAALCAGAIVAASTLWMQILLFALLAATLAATRLPARLVLQGVRGGAFVLLFVAVANGLWFLVARYWGWAGATVAVASPADVGRLLLRLTNLFLLGGVLVATTSPADATAAADSLLQPLGRIHAPWRELGLVVGLAVGFVPLLSQETRRLATLLRLRRGRRRWRLWDRARAAVPLLVPLFVGVLRRADEVALALDARGFAPRAARTSFTGAHYGRSEWLVLLGAGTLLALGFRY